MGASQSTSTALTSSAVNEFAQTSIEKCQASGTAQVNNSGIIINGSRVQGNVGIVAASVVDQSCVMQNSLDAEVTNLINNLVQQEQAQEASFLNWFSKQNSSVNNNSSVVNNISQTLASICSSTSTASINNANIDIIGSDVGGNVSIASTTSINNQCNMVNAGKIQVFNDLQNNVKQKQTQLDLFGLAAMAIIAVIAIIVIVIIVLVLGSVLRGGGGDSRTEIIGTGGAAPTTGVAGDQQNSLLQLAEFKTLTGGGSSGGAVAAGKGAEATKVGGLAKEASIAEEALLL